MLNFILRVSSQGLCLIRVSTKSSGIALNDLLSVWHIIECMALCFFKTPPFISDHAIPRNPDVS